MKHFWLREGGAAQCRNCGLGPLLPSALKQPYPLCTGSPCTDHPCDLCAGCSSGRCCRKDIEHYTLPATGSWPEPIYGNLGIVNRNGNTVECHICGEEYRAVAFHANRTHDVTEQEYKAYFGLNATASLIGAETKKLLRQRALVTQRPYFRDSPKWTPEQISAYKTGKKARLQARKSNSAARPDVRAKISAARKANPNPENLGAFIQPKAFGEVTCKVCGKLFTTNMAKTKRRIVCSWACRSEAISQGQKRYHAGVRVHHDN